jgi:hypothetical protein
MIEGEWNIEKAQELITKLCLLNLKPNTAITSHATNTKRRTK